MDSIGQLIVQLWYWITDWIDSSYKFAYSCPFIHLSVRAFEDEKKAKMGVVECVKHELLEPYNVLYEREGKFN